MSQTGKFERRQRRDGAGKEYGKLRSGGHYVMGSQATSPKTAGNVLTGVAAHPKTIKEIVASFRSLLDGNEQEQRETFSFLKQALEDRPSSRRLFPSS